jgi:cyclase
MLKKRIIPLLLWEDGRLVKTRQFSSPRVVGDLVKTCRVYSDQDADEIIILNISKSEESWGSFLSSVLNLSREVMMPISVGGGIRSMQQAEEAFRAGADKIVLNTACYDNPALLEKISSQFGAQAIVASLDFRTSSGLTALWAENGTEPKSVSLQVHLAKLQAIGIGEVMLQSIDRDGMKQGYELKVLQDTLLATTVPVIVSGGAGNFSHLHEAFDLGVDAVACGSLFNFGDNNPLRAKAFLRNYGVPLKKSI